VIAPGIRGVRADHYNYSAANSCGGSESGQLLVVRSGGVVRAVIPNEAVIEGKMTSSSGFSFRVKYLSSCGIGAEGTGTITADGTIAGTYSGTSGGGLGCCPAGPFSGSFSMVPR
jgi:hypothetical protein